MENKTKIVIKRTSQYANLMRKIKIFCNNEIIGYIGNGETKEFFLPEGEKTIYAKIDWCRCRPVVMAGNKAEDKVYELGCNLKGIKLLLTLFWIIFKAKDYLYLKETNVTLS